jgi:hypothetical protein
MGRLVTTRLWACRRDRSRCSCSSWRGGRRTRSRRGIARTGSTWAYTPALSSLRSPAPTSARWYAESMPPHPDDEQLMAVWPIRPLPLQMNAIGSQRQAHAVHHALLGSVLRAPMAFFHSTSPGRVLHLFSRDLAVIDRYAHRASGWPLLAVRRPLHTIHIIRVDAQVGVYYDRVPAGAVFLHGPDGAVHGVLLALDPDRPRRQGGMWAAAVRCPGMAAAATPLAVGGCRCRCTSC